MVAVLRTFDLFWHLGPQWMTSVFGLAQHWSNVQYGSDMGTVNVDQMLGHHKS